MIAAEDHPPLINLRPCLHLAIKGNRDMNRGGRGNHKFLLVLKDIKVSPFTCSRGSSTFFLYH